MKITVPCVDENGYQLTIEGEGGADVYKTIQHFIESNGWKQTKKSTFGAKKEAEKFDPTVQKVCVTCGGYMKPKEGVSAAGKAYKGWFCPNSREKGCQPVWAS